MKNPPKQGLLGAIYDSWCRPFLRTTIAEEISSFSRYYDQVIQLLPVEGEEKPLLDFVDCQQKRLLHWEEIPQMRGQDSNRSIILLNGDFNHSYDIQELLDNLKKRLSRSSRVVVVVYNSYFRWLYILANKLGIRSGKLETTFITQRDLVNLAKLSDYEIIKSIPLAYFPFSLLGLGRLLNRIFSNLPLIKQLGFAQVVMLRPIIPSEKPPSLTVIIPARNELGNIENALKRMPKLGGVPIEIIFVEGNSTDATWAEIQRVVPLYQSQFFKIKTLQQREKGKCDAVRCGLEVAECELVTILDADLTMPPELLDRFYEAYRQGKGDFVNGTRLVYPMEGEAMRPLNWMGNVFFAKALSWILHSNLSDTLCGTKLWRLDDYQRMVRWRNDFGDFDPFGDFELLFSASILGLGVANIPIRYRARTYGSTNIRRFRDGFILLKMTWIGLFRIKL